MALTRLSNQSLTSISSLPAGVGGKVLQVVSGSTATAVTSTSSTYADTGLTANITPSSSSNKILILVDQLIFLDANDNSIETAGRIKLLRDSTAIISTGSVNDFRLTAEHAPNGELRVGNRFHFSILDTPSTTSQITYKTQFNFQAGVQTIVNRSSSPARITLMEIAG